LLSLGSEPVAQAPSQEMNVFKHGLKLSRQPTVAKENR
jgi:hypothetical protein